MVVDRRIKERVAELRQESPAARQRPQFQRGALAIRRLAQADLPPGRRRSNRKRAERLVRRKMFGHQERELNPQMADRSAAIDDLQQLPDPVRLIMAQAESAHGAGAGRPKHREQSQTEKDFGGLHFSLHGDHN